MSDRNHAQNANTGKIRDMKQQHQTLQSQLKQSSLHKENRSKLSPGESSIEQKPHLKSYDYSILFSQEKGISDTEALDLYPQKNPNPISNFDLSKFKATAKFGDGGTEISIQDSDAITKTKRTDLDVNNCQNGDESNSEIKFIYESHSSRLQDHDSFGFENPEKNKTQKTSKNARDRRSPMEMLKELTKESPRHSFLNSSFKLRRTQNYCDLTMNSDDQKSSGAGSNCTSKLSKSESPENIQVIAGDLDNPNPISN